MKSTWKPLAAMLSYVMGIIGWCYVGGFLILTGPVKALLLAHHMGNLSIGKFLAAGIQGFIYLSLAGAVWCVGYMLSCHFKE